MSDEPAVPAEQQEALYAAIGNELIALTPDSWQDILLEVVVNVSGSGILGMSHEITSPEGYRSPIMPSDELFDLTHKLLILFQEHGKAWKQIRFEVWQVPGESWRYKCDFTYG